MTKNIGSKQLNKVANQIVGSKNKMAKNIIANNNVRYKTAKSIAKVVNSTEKAIAKQVVKEAPQKATETIVAGGADAAQKKIIEQK